MKQDFYLAFAQLHRTRVNNYFEAKTPLYKFISDFIYVNAYDASNQIFCRNSNKACQKINTFLECDFYSSELNGACYDSDGLMLGFSISTKPEAFDHLSFDLFIRPHNEYCAIAFEELQFNQPGKNPWSILCLELEAESTFGSLKRIPVASNP